MHRELVEEDMDREGRRRWSGEEKEGKGVLSPLYWKKTV